ncbi:MAG: M14 family metallopeptidase [Bacteroidetes bacterium]|nr:M14 family metallopeptidase [Bacteroidota bacterium]
MRMRKLLGPLLWPYLLWAQVPDDGFYPGGRYAPEVPHPQTFLGYTPGEDFTPYDRVVAYLEAVARASARSRLVRYGQTHLGRPLHYMVLTDPANMARLEEIRQANLRLAEPRTLSAAEQERIVRENPVVVWLSYNVHGNEPPSTEAALRVIYQLAAGQDERTLRILRQAVVIVDPCLNPDGRERYVQYFRAYRQLRPNDNPDVVQHEEPWPGGRTNHYLFDLNRDWAWLVHPESRARIAAYRQWLPQVHIDYHEQNYNANYFTMPGMRPRNLLLPEENHQLAQRIGEAMNRAFDREQIQYFTRERFEFFYPGYGSSYPSLQGAIGMLTEQGGGSRAGLLVQTWDGTMLSFRQRVYNHFLTSMAALEEAVERREELLRYMARFFRDGISLRKGPALYVFPDRTESYLYRLLGVLHAHGVEIERARAPFVVPRPFDYRTGAPGPSRSFPAGTWIVRADQPRQVLVHTLLLREMALEDSLFYDVSTWSAPLAFGVEGYWSEQPLNVATERVTEPPTYRGQVRGLPAAYAYLIPWDHVQAPRALVRLWGWGYRVRSAGRPFRLEGRDFPRGSLILLLGQQPDSLRDRVHEDMRRLADQTGVWIYGAQRALVESGRDLASPSHIPIRPPRVLLVADRPISMYSYGQLWYAFEQELGYTVHPVRLSSLAQVDLRRYDVILFPGGGNLRPFIDSTLQARLRAWVESGGVLVALEGSALFFTQDRSRFTRVELVRPQEALQRARDAYTARLGWEAREDDQRHQELAGVALRGELDPTHPLGYGLEGEVYVFAQLAEAFRWNPQASGISWAGRYGADPNTLKVSGFISAYNRAKLAGGVWAALVQMGRGKVVLMLPNPNFRMYWLAYQRMLWNAVFLLPAL